MTKYPRQIEQLIPDIFRYLEDRSEKDTVLSEDDVSLLSTQIADMLKNRAEERRSDEFTLRLSNYGQGNRKLWFDSRYGRERKNGQTYMKFLLGDLFECMILFLAKKAGHTVEEEQGKVMLEGVAGTKDAKIDGITVDVKSASPYAFKYKFKEAGLLKTGGDTFGYVHQILGYNKAGGTDRCGFLAGEKATGELTFLEMPQVMVKTIDPAVKMNEAKAALLLDTPPEEKCFEPEPMGTSGNMTLSSGCTWCPHKMTCWADANQGKGLRVFQYAKGPTFFTDVRSAPKVEEITDRYQAYRYDDEE